MKNIKKYSLILLALILVSSCTKEKMIKTNPDFILSYQRDGQANAMAGTKFYVIPTGSAEFFTLFDGTAGHVWGEPGAKGLDFNKADSLGLVYLSGGKYNLTLVASSSGDFGNEFSRTTRTVEVSVIDVRNSFTIFSIGGIDGVFTPNNEILFQVPDATTDYTFVASFGVDSGDAKVYVNGVQQTSGKSANDFSQPVVYTVVSSNGDEKQYTVKFSTFPSSDEKAITKFTLGLGGNGESAVIDETNKIIQLTANYATPVNSVRLVLASSYGSSIYINNALYSDRKNYDLNSISEVKVVAQNKSEAIYKLQLTADNPVKTFTFAGLVPEPVGVIDPVAKTVTVEVLSGTDVTKLAAKWTGSVGKVTVSGVNQVNGVTVNDFTTTQTYTFYKGTVPGDRYKISVVLK